MDATEYKFLKQLLVEFEDVKDTLATSTSINIQLGEQNKLLSEKALTSDGQLLETKKTKPTIATTVEMKICLFISIF